MAQRRLSQLKEIVRPYYLKWLYFHLRASNRPTSFTACWKYPASEFHAANSWPAPVSDKPDILFLPMGDWHGRVQRTHHLATAFATLGHRCFYMNPHLGREFPSTYFSSPRRIVSKLESRIFELHVHLFREPVFHHRCLQDHENEAVVEAIDEMLNMASARQLVIVVSFPLWREIAESLKERWACPLVYDCHDHLAGFGNIAADLLECEEQLLDKCDLAAFSARWLLEDAVSRNPSVERKSVLVPNAVTLSDFQTSRRPRTIDGAKQAPTIGYVGALNFWFDVESVRAAALAHPAWKFVLVGRVESRGFEVLRHLPNVEFRGEIPYRELGRHLADFDAAMIPFLPSPLTIATNPIKLYEYFACGLPVVSSNLPEVERFGDLVYLASDRSEFVTQLECAVNETDLNLRDRRIAVAKRENWMARCQSVQMALTDVVLAGASERESSPSAV